MQRRVFMGLSIGLLAAVVGVRAGEPGPWIELFDGKTLEGWTQRNGTAVYEAREGTIVGTTAVGSPNSFLCSDADFADFELEFEVKCDDGLNSGVQIRSRQKGDENLTEEEKKTFKGRVYGPQVEIEAGPGQAGYIYGEATGLAWLSEEPKSKDPAVNRHAYYKNGEWNRYRVIAEGPRIRTFINDQPIADLTHDEVFKTHPSGFIGLQVHGIPKTKGPFSVAWRNTRIRVLNP